MLTKKTFLSVPPFSKRDMSMSASASLSPFDKDRSQTPMEDFRESEPAMTFPLSPSLLPMEDFRESEMTPNLTAKLASFSLEGGVRAMPQAKMTPMEDIPMEDAREPEDLNEERSQMSAYWAKHTGSDPTFSTMMLMKEGSEKVISAAEMKEVFAALGDVSGKMVLELGAGMGRYTRHFANLNVKGLHAVDFMQASIDKNKKLHCHFPGFTFQQADVTMVDFPEGKFDVVFSNWLQMYLGDQEVEEFAKNAARWCKPGGIIFFRESCAGGPSGDKPREGFNPTHYRQAAHYCKLFDALPGVKRVNHSQLKSYVEIKKKTNQYMWKYEKVE